MLHHHALTSLDMSTSEVRRHVSLLLQIIAIEYAEAFGKLITYKGKGRGQSIGEQVGDAFDRAFESDTFSIFPKRKVRSNVYYIVGFLGIQAEKHAKRLAKGSGRQLCLSYFAVERFAVRNKGGEDAVNKLVNETAIPTSMVETRERYGGLRYADARCWRFFSSIEYVFASIATADNFVACGGSIIKDLTQALQCNKKICQAFAELCDVESSTVFNATDAAACFQYLLLVFGRVRARDLALKYNANLYRGKNPTSLRSGLAAHTVDNKKRKKKKPKKNSEKKPVEEVAEQAEHDELVCCLDEVNEEIECSKKLCTNPNE